MKLNQFDINQFVGRTVKAVEQGNYELELTFSDDSVLTIGWGDPLEVYFIGKDGDSRNETQTRR